MTLGIAALVLAIIEINDWGWNSPGVLSAFLAAIVLLGAFAIHCLRSSNPFVDPALFRVRQYTGAVFTMVFFSAAFGAMLLSVALWDQTAWGWSALQTGLAILPGPLLVPATSLLLSGKLIARFGHAAVIASGILAMALGLVIWVLAVNDVPNAWAIVLGMLPIGIGVGLTFPTLMGVAVASLPPSSFSTGSGVINMIRQAALAVGVAVFITIIGSPETPAARLHAFHEGWWIMMVVTLAGLPTTLWLIRTPKRLS